MTVKKTIEIDVTPRIDSIEILTHEEHAVVIHYTTVGPDGAPVTLYTDDGQRIPASKSVRTPIIVDGLPNPIFGDALTEAAKPLGVNLGLPNHMAGFLLLNTIRDAVVAVGVEHGRIEVTDKPETLLS